MAKTHEQTVELSVAYDKDSDTLEIHLGKARPAISIEVEEGLLLRVDPKTKEVLGLSVLFFSKQCEALSEKKTPKVEVRGEPFKLSGPMSRHLSAASP